MFSINIQYYYRSSHQTHHVCHVHECVSKGEEPFQQLQPPLPSLCWRDLSMRLFQLSASSSSASSCFCLLSLFPKIIKPYTCILKHDNLDQL